MRFPIAVTLGKGFQVAKYRSDRFERNDLPAITAFAQPLAEPSEIGADIEHDIDMAREQKISHVRKTTRPDAPDIETERTHALLDASF